MKANIKHRVTPVKAIPLHNIQSFIRVPGHPPTKLSQALHEWDWWTIIPTARRMHDPGEEDLRWLRELHFVLEDGSRASIPISEQIYEVALFSVAQRRFADFMKVERAKNA